MLESDEIWEKIRPNMNVIEDSIFVKLREIYREGIPTEDFTTAQLEGSKKTLLHSFKDWRERISPVKLKNYLQELFGKLIMNSLQSNAILRSASVLLFFIIWQVSSLVVNVDLLPALRKYF